MIYFDCEKGYVPDNGQNDVQDGSVENYDFDWNEPEDDAADTTQSGQPEQPEQPMQPES